MCTGVKVEDEGDIDVSGTPAHEIDTDTERQQDWEEEGAPELKYYMLQIHTSSATAIA